MNWVLTAKKIQQHLVTFLYIELFANNGKKMDDNRAVWETILCT